MGGTKDNGNCVFILVHPTDYPKRNKILTENKVTHWDRTF